MSVRMEQLGSQRTDFHEIFTWDVFRKYIGKIRISLESDKNNWYCTWRPVYIFNRMLLSPS